MIDKEIIVVTGLPRSGTSLMMQLLQAIGIGLFTDDIRNSNDANPKGYFEHEMVKSIEKDASWMAGARGKAIKIVSSLLIHLPLKFKYKIIFMHRDYKEIIKSQDTMLSQNNNPKTIVEPEILKRIFSKDEKQAKEWLKDNHNCDFITVSHRNLVNNPELELPQILNFLKAEADLNTLTKVVDKSLYRAKIS